MARSAVLEDPHSGWYFRSSHDVLANTLSLSSYIYNSAGSDFGDNDNERAYDPVGDRGPGHPLFPSNFARLALGPTLSAK